MTYIIWRLDVTPDFKRRTISSEATLTFQPIAKPLDKLQLDSIDLDIQSVTSTAKIEAYDVSADHLVITFAEALPTDKEASVTIHYTAQPQKGVYFRTPEMGYDAGDERTCSHRVKPSTNAIGIPVTIRPIRSLPRKSPATFRTG